MNERQLYECIVLTDSNGNEYVYYGKHQIAGVGGITIADMRVKGPQYLSVPLSDFIGEVMNKKVVPDP